MADSTIAIESKTESLPKVPVATLWESIQPHLTKADEQSKAIRDACIASVQGYFDRIRSGNGAKSFADEVLGFKAKFNYISQNNSDYRAWIVEKLEANVLSKSDVQSAISHALNHFTQQLEQIDNQLLVAVRADVPQIPSEWSLALTTVENIGTSFENLVSATQQTICEEVLKSLVCDTGSFLASDVLAGATTRSLKEHGHLDDGFGSNLIGLGINLLYNVVTDEVVKQINHSDEKIISQVNESLQAVENSTLAKLSDSMDELAKRKGADRRAVLAKAIGVEQ